MASLPARDRSRSPRFPSSPIDVGIEYAKRIYDGVHRSPIDAQTSFRLMGFAGRSGASATALGTIRQFGLIEGTGENTRVSDLALRIFEPESQREKAEAILQALKEPAVFRSILDRFGGKVPNADEPVRAFLIRDLGFSKSGAEDCLASLRSSIQYVGQFEEPIDTTPSVVVGGNATSDELLAESDTSRRVPFDRRSELIRIPLTRDCFAELRLSGEITARAIDTLISHIGLMKEVWAED